MKYTASITLHLPRERVVALFDDPANLKRWQPTLIRFERLGGEPGQVGARARLRYRQGKREVELIETVTVRALPERFAGTYEMPGVWNQVDNRFEAVGPDETLWHAEVEFRFAGLWMRLLGWLGPGMFRRQTEKLMQRFKDFAESQTDEGFEKTQFVP